MKVGEMMDVRQYHPADEEAVIAFSLRAWEPVFAAWRETLGDDLFGTLYYDWRAEQEQAVRNVLADAENTTWVWADASTVAGFVSAAIFDRTPPKGKTAEIVMLAVDPDHQGNGIGLRLTEIAIQWGRDQGAELFAVESGGDPGHAPARATYEKAQFTLMPIARYFQRL